MNRRQFLTAAATLPIIQQFPSRTCTAEDARDNTPNTPPKDGIDWIPPGFLVAYSPRLYHPLLPGNVGMFVIPLAHNQVLIFGTGYANMVFNQRGVKADMALLDHAIKDCLGLQHPSLVIVAPHWHPDHVSPEGVHELRRLGYQIDTLIFHAADAPFYRNIPEWMYDGVREERWTDEDWNAAIMLDGTGCTWMSWHESSP